MLKQRVYGLRLGYEDLNDHDRLHFDPLLAVLVDKKDPEPSATTASGATRRGERLAFVWYLRGFSHVHSWIPVADETAVPVTSHFG